MDVLALDRLRPIFIETVVVARKAKRFASLGAAKCPLGAGRILLLAFSIAVLCGCASRGGSPPRADEAAAREQVAENIDVYAAVSAYFGDARGGYVVPDTPLGEQLMLAMSIPDNADGTAERARAARAGLTLRTGCRQHNCQEKGALVTDATGTVIRAALISFLCDEGGCKQTPTLTIFVADGASDFGRVDRILLGWGERMVPGIRGDRKRLVEQAGSATSYAEVRQGSPEYEESFDLLVDLLSADTPAPLPADLDWLFNPVDDSQPTRGPGFIWSDAASTPGFFSSYQITYRRGYEQDSEVPRATIDLLSLLRKPDSGTSCIDIRELARSLDLVESLPVVNMHSLRGWVIEASSRSGDSRGKLYTDDQNYPCITGIRWSWR